MCTIYVNQIQLLSLKTSSAPPGEGAAAAAAWAPQTPEWQGGDLDPFGKGKGKGAGSKDQPRGPLECYGCFGKGHPQRLCPTPPGMSGKPGAQVCELATARATASSNAPLEVEASGPTPASTRRAKVQAAMVQAMARRAKARASTEAKALEKAKANSTVLMGLMHLQASSTSGNHSGNHSGSPRQQLSPSSHGWPPQRPTSRLETHGHSGAGSSSSGPAQVASIALPPDFGKPFQFP